MLRRSVRYPYAATRARALAAGFLPYQEYQELARLSGVDEGLSRLRERGTLPAELSRDLGNVAAAFLTFGRSIARTLAGADRALVEGYLNRVDVENLKVICRGIVRDRDGEGIRPLLSVEGSEPRFAPGRLGQARSLEELATLLPPSAFRRIIHNSADLPAEKRLFTLESALDRAYWQGIALRLKRLASLDRFGAGEILSLRADIDRFNVIHRGLQAGLEARAILAILPPGDGAFSIGRLRNVLALASPIEALAEVFPVPEVSNPLSPEGEVALWRRLRRHLRRVLRSHPFDISISLAALLLKEIEVRDLEVVLSALRLGKSDQIDELLTTGKG